MGPLKKHPGAKSQKNQLRYAKFLTKICLCNGVNIPRIQELVARTDPSPFKDSNNFMLEYCSAFFNVVVYSNISHIISSN